MSYDEREAFEEFVTFTEKSMDFDVDPCTDFVQYAGGKFREEHFNTKASEWPPGSLDITQVVYSLLEDERVSNPALQKARNFRKSKDALLQNGIKEFFKSDQLIEFCGGVPLFNDNWREENFNLAKTAGVFSALSLNTILKPKVEYLDDVKVISVDYIYLRGTYFLECLNETFEQLELNDEKLSNVVNELNAILETYPNDLLEGESVSVPGVDVGNIEIFDLREFIETALCIKIKDNDTIYLQEGVMQSLVILNRISQKALAHYITIMATLQMNQNEMFALFEFMKYFKPVFLSTGINAYYTDEEHKKLKHMVNSFCDSFEIVKEDFPEGARESQYFLFGMDIDLILEDIKENFNLCKITSEYDNLDICSNDFYQNLISIKNHQTPMSLKYYYSRRGDDKLKISSNQNLLSHLLENYKKPMVYHFGSLPSTFWRSIIIDRIFYPENSQNEKFKIPEESLRSQIVHREDWLSQFSAQEIVTSIEGLHYSYNNYKKWMKENETTVKWQDNILSRINLDCRKLFFVVFVQYGIYDPDKCTPTSALMNFMDFSDVFGCSPDSPMNPRKFMLIN